MFIVTVFTGMAFGQKVKYKDLLVLLNARQYDQAEPFLKRYLAETSDNASAYLFMGIIYQEKAFKSDVLKQTEGVISFVDSAVFFYNKCLPKLTDKEIKKNDENYQMYTRRDLRTGEFGIKLSDIQLDLETRTKALYERRDRVILLRKYYQDAEAGYVRSNSLFKSLTNSFNAKKELILQADDTLIFKLERLSTTFDSSQLSFKNYKTTLQSLGKTGYNQVVDLQEIKDFKKDGSSLADFMTDDLKLWDYAGWARKTLRIIKDEVYPHRKELVAFDMQINKMREKIRKDSVLINTQELRRNPLFDELKKWDTDPMPFSLFQMKISELEYTSDLMAESFLTDKDVSKKIGLIKQQQILLKNIDSLATVLVNRDWTADAVNYRHFIADAYGTPVVIKNLGKSTLEFARRETALKKQELEDNMSLLKWVISESDSIPLFQDVPDESRYKPLIIAETHTAGVKQSDGMLTGYFYTVTPSRTADLKAIFPVDSVSIKQRELPLIKGLSLAVTDQSYFILFYSESKVDGNIPVTLAKISRVSGLEWSSVFSVGFTPVELKFASSSGELSLKTVSPDGDSKMVVLDKTGNRLQ